MKVRKAIIPAAGPRKILATPAGYVLESWWRVFGANPALFFIRCGGQYRD